jgi:hypothetical protein
VGKPSNPVYDPAARLPPGDAALGIKDAGGSFAMTRLLRRFQGRSSAAYEIRLPRR